MYNNQITPTHIYARTMTQSPRVSSRLPTTSLTINGNEDGHNSQVTTHGHGYKPNKVLKTTNNEKVKMATRLWSRLLQTNTLTLHSPSWKLLQTPFEAWPLEACPSAFRILWVLGSTHDQRCHRCSQREMLLAF